MRKLASLITLSLALLTVGFYCVSQAQAPNVRAVILAKKPTSAPVIPTLWDPGHNGGTISNGGRDFTAAGFNGVQSTTSRTSGKWYFELQIQSSTATDYYYPGISTSQTSAAWGGGIPGQLAGSFAADGGGGYGSATSPSTGFSVGTAPSANHTGANGDTIMMAVDFDAGSIWIGFNGTWLSNQNPAAGTNTYYTFTPGGTWFIAGGVYGGVPTPNLRLPATNTFAPPSGFSVWNSYLLKRDLVPAANDNSPAFMDGVAA